MVVLDSGSEQQDNSRREEWQARKNALEAMVKHPGWEVYVELMNTSMKMSEVARDKATEPAIMAKMIGVSKTLRDMISWPEREIVALRSALESE